MYCQDLLDPFLIDDFNCVDRILLDYNYDPIRIWKEATEYCCVQNRWWRSIQTCDKDMLEANKPRPQHICR